MFGRTLSALPSCSCGGWSLVAVVIAGAGAVVVAVGAVLILAITIAAGRLCTCAFVLSNDAVACFSG